MVRITGNLRRILFALGALVLLGALALSLLFVWTWRRNPPAEVTDVRRSPNGEVHIGDRVTVRATIRCPWYRLPPPAAELMPGEGVQQLGTVRRRLAGIGAGIWYWEYAATLQPYTLGELTAGALSIPLPADRLGEAEPLRVPLPDLSVTPRLAEDGTKDLSLADRIPRSVLENGGRLWLYTLLAALGAAIVLFALWRKRREPSGRRTPEKPPWRVAGEQLQALENRLPLPAETFTVALTDILRTYIERRFGLRAAEQTTQEFLREAQNTEALSVDQRALLSDVLTSADLIKFARSDATQKQLENSLNHAVTFVVETTPKDDGRQTDPDTSPADAPEGP